jgi:DNA-directed RNA polymerase subunit beta'
MEARVLMMSTNNILSPANGKPIIVPSQDIVLGLYHLTRERPYAKGEYKEDKKGRAVRGVFGSAEEVRMAYDHGEIHLQAKIKLRRDKDDGTGRELVETTVGRTLLYDICPRELPFESINRVMGKKQLAELIDLVYREAGQKATVLLADALRTTGYTFATKAGISICLDDMVIPPSKETLLDEAKKEVAEIEEQYTEGLITDGERYNKVVDIWAQVAEAIAKDMMKEISTDDFKDPEGSTA